MDIEPLQSILEISNNRQKTILYYVSDEIKYQLQNLEYQQHMKDLYVNEHIYLLSKNTLELQHHGIITNIQDNQITIKKNNYFFIHINPQQYYIFVKHSRKISKQRDFMEELLDQL